jgi:hypothetical protein
MVGWSGIEDAAAAAFLYLSKDESVLTVSITERKSSDFPRRYGVSKLFCRVNVGTVSSVEVLEFSVLSHGNNFLCGSTRSDVLLLRTDDVESDAFGRLDDLGLSIKLMLEELTLIPIFVDTGKLKDPETACF